MSISKCGKNEVMRNVRYFGEDPSEKKFCDFRRAKDKAILSRTEHTEAIEDFMGVGQAEPKMNKWDRL